MATPSPTVEFDNWEVLLTDWTGDTELTEFTDRVLSKHHVAAIATVTDGVPRVATRGIEPTADFEIGSISKGITALLYSEALADGLIDETTVIGDLLPVASDTDVAKVPLRAISTHRSGLPSLPPAMKPYRRSATWLVKGVNPYGETLDELLQQVATIRIRSTEPTYSNLGFQLLGHAVARARGVSYQRLLNDRITEPLGLSTFYVPYSQDEVRSTGLVGTNRSRSKPRQPWVGEAFAPCGGIRADIGSMRDLLLALLTETAPGMAALDPVEPYSGRIQIGAAWLTQFTNGIEITWHNGATGGFRSWMGVDRVRNNGVVILTAQHRSVDFAGARMLGELTR